MPDAPQQITARFLEEHRYYDFAYALQQSGDLIELRFLVGVTMHNFLMQRPLAEQLAKDVLAPSIHIAKPTDLQGRL